MNNKTKLALAGPQLTTRWKHYRRHFQKTNIDTWCICSDYCVDDKEKPNDIITFTIFPYNFIRKVLADTKHFIPHDIKDTTHISEDTINYLKNNKDCFSISINLINKSKSIKQEEMQIHFNEKIKEYNQFPKDMQKIYRDKYKCLYKFVQRLNNKNVNKKLLSTLILVSHWVSYCIEYLIIKENAKKVYWISDRDKILSFNNSIIYHILNSLVYSLVKERKTYIIALFPENELVNFDPILRIPDFISGTLASIHFNKDCVIANKEKHYKLFNEIIADNPRILIISKIFDNQEEHLELLYTFEKI